MLQALGQLACCLGRERDREDVLGLELTRNDLVRDPAGDRRRLARTRAGEDADRATPLAFALLVSVARSDSLADHA
jgi:hypothetical protein